MQVVRAALKLGLEPSRSDPRLHDDEKDLRSVETLCGCVCNSVEECLWTNKKKMKRVMDSLGKQFGFGNEFNKFVFCGRRFQRLPGGSIQIDMKEYPRHRAGASFKGSAGASRLRASERV